MPLTPDQLRAARALLNISQDDLAKESGVAVTSIRQFELGTTLAEADRPVALNHPHCAKFCVLGGAACSR